MCDTHAALVKDPRTPDSCGECVCKHGYAGPGTLCGRDADSDGWSDVALSCSEAKCVQDNCVGAPNSGQEDSDNDGEGDSCDDGLSCRF